MSVDPSKFNNHEREVWFDGMRSGIRIAAALAAVYNGQPDIGARTSSAGGAQVDLLEETIRAQRSAP